MNDVAKSFHVRTGANRRLGAAGRVLGRFELYTALFLVTAVCLGWASHRSATISSVSAEQVRAAAQCGDVGAVEAALAAGADFDARDDMGNTALLIAACANHPEAARLLLRQGADANVISRGYGTPLGAAARHGQLTLVEDLLSAGADPDAPEEVIDTPLYRCASSDAGDFPDIALALLRLGANPHRADGKGRTALQAARTAGNHRVAKVLSSVGSG